MLGQKTRAKTEISPINLISPKREIPFKEWRTQRQTASSMVLLIFLSICIQVFVTIAASEIFFLEKFFVFLHKVQ